MKFLTAVVATACLVNAANSNAQAFPTRNITFLVNSTGGILEATTRTILDRVKENTGATVILEPRLGGGGAVGLQATKRATPDGHTVGITFASALNLGPLINRDLDLDPLKDFVPITNMFAIGSVVMTREDAPYKDLRDLVAAAKAKPGSLSFGVFGAGNKVWLAQLEDLGGGKFLQVPVKGSEDSIALLMGGHIEATLSTAGTVAAQKGKLKALAFGLPRPSPALPGVPTVPQMFGFEMSSWYGVLAPAGTPPAAVAWLSRELVRATRDPKVVKMIDDASFTLVGSSSDEFARALRAEVESNAAILRKYPEIR